MAPRAYPCVVCSKRTKPVERRPISGNKSLRKYLLKTYLIRAQEGDVICGRCRQQHRRHQLSNIPSSTRSNQSSDHDISAKKSRLSSPRNITLPIPSTGGSHTKCVVCQSFPSHLIVVPRDTKYSLFLLKGILLPVGTRCCPVHIKHGLFSSEALECIVASRDSTSVNRTDIAQLITSIRDAANKSQDQRINFDSPDALSNDDYVSLTGLGREQFCDLCSHLKSTLRNTKNRSLKACVGIFLTKLKGGMSNRMLSTVFNIGKDSIRRAMTSARNALVQDFVPSYLGFKHISRDDVITKHTRPLAQTLFGGLMKPAILVIDGTYIYIQKSGQYLFQRRSYSMHKHKPLVKPMMFVTTTGYIVSVIGPYFADSKNNDAGILNHILRRNVEEITDWLTENDVVIVDRGFRDSVELLEEFGIHTEMPTFSKKRQHTTMESNASRLVTKIRWVVESVNGRMKTWKYLDRILPNSQIPYIGDMVRIVCAICNKYRSDLSTGDAQSDQLLGAKMLFLSKQVNILQNRIEEGGFASKRSIWAKIDESASLNFPVLTEEDLRNLTLGVYQIKLARGYTKEHLNDTGGYEVFVCKVESNIISAKIQSRHVSSKVHQLWIMFDECTVQGWYCKCRTGARTVGSCAHVASVIWYLGFARHSDIEFHLGKDWSQYLLDAASPEPISVDGSDEETSEE
ncbi:uncharacterized protein LOC117319467 [Pecten maximus]|uniref:uncharacterized protein LOC117319467 n=1 Tax=Pecten maximus TaxID=6579 RepID=UPI00145884A2|nr:uncharacterized protein LOC117319467 [Pecten maximus]